MYKCRECGAEYDIKPDYCDCGNDEFDITDNPQSAKTEKNKLENEEKIKEPLPTKEIEVQKADSYRVYQKFTPVSLGIFILCLILSLAVILFPVKESEIVNHDSGNTATVQKIPSIDKFWNNALPEVKKYDEVKKSEPYEPQVVVAKPVQKTVQKTANKQVKPVKVSTQQTVNPAKKTITPQKTEEDSRKAAEEAAKKMAEVKKQAEDLQQAMSDKMEYANYKVKLRNTLGQKIDFTRVIGDGDCIISFNIDQSGRLINGAFAKQSDNITLNNAVYNAFMSSRSFTPPPVYYKNETLKLNVRFYNGNFDISLN